MHKYLKTIGFSQYNTTKKINELKQEIVAHPTRKNVHALEEDLIFCYEKDFGECFGISLIKIGETEEESVIEGFFPYVRGYNYLYNEKFEIDPFSSGEGFYGYCDDNNIGIPVIFCINNPVEFRKMRNRFRDDNALNCVTLSGLAIDGIVLLPIERNAEQLKEEHRANEIRNNMINEAKAGNIEAMEKLTIQDMTKFTAVNIRSQKEDIFTIVSTYFMPHTVECDKYSILADIIDVAEMKNKMTGEEMYYISLNCNEIEFEILINKNDLMGTPEKGRRFKGHIWLQGQLDNI